MKAYISPASIPSCIILKQRLRVTENFPKNSLLTVNKIKFTLKYYLHFTFILEFTKYLYIKVVLKIQKQLSIILLYTLNSRINAPRNLLN